MSLCESEENKRINSTIYLHDGLVTKVFDSEVEIEYKKSITMWELSNEGSFAFPKPVGLNRERKSIDFEFIKTEGSIRKFYLDFMMSSEIDRTKLDYFVECGRVLGEIHCLPLQESQYKWMPSELFLEALGRLGRDKFCASLDSFDSKFLHCDFGFENIEYVMHNDRWSLAIFDASPNYFTTYHAHTSGPIYVDIGNFLSVIEGLVPLKNYPKMKWERLHEIREAFFCGYESRSGVEIDRVVSQAFSYASAYCYFTKKYKNSVFRRIGLSLLFNNFKGNYNFRVN